MYVLILFPKFLLYVCLLSSGDSDDTIANARYIGAARTHRSDGRRGFAVPV